MPHAKIALLPDRGVVRVAGEDAERLLQGVITNDIDLLGKQSAIHAALLTPQGKVLFEFFVTKARGGFLLETAKDQAAALAKRLAMYKLRAKVDFRESSAEYAVLAAWGGELPNPGETEHMVSFLDPRLPEMGLRVLADATFAGKVAAATSGIEASEEDYHAHRAALGVPEAGRDYVLGDIFPHEANFDLLQGVSFSKGCFVGQEVVSRMQHRGTARKRIVIIEADHPLQAGDEIMAGQAAIGAIGSVSGARALAIIRLDRAEEAQRKGEDLTAGGIAVAVRVPSYLQPPVAASAP
ncbi:MAG: hypothetical protein K2X43_20355 [Hyphomonadaceae bacterium]|jgi:folate-binding protein YgfZ|nr:hypothetical protein [Hyphomonadaceae bacterium]